MCVGPTAKSIDVKILNPSSVLSISLSLPLRACRFWAVSSARSGYTWGPFTRVARSAVCVLGTRLKYAQTAEPIEMLYESRLVWAQ